MCTLPSGLDSEWRGGFGDRVGDGRGERADVGRGDRDADSDLCSESCDEDTPGESSRAFSDSKESWEGFETLLELDSCNRIFFKSFRQVKQEPCLWFHSFTDHLFCKQVPLYSRLQKVS